MKWINRFGLNWPVHLKKSNESMCLPEIQDTMLKSNVPSDFVVHAVRIAHTDKRVYDLMNMWLASDSLEEQGRIISDIQSIIETTD